MFCGFVAPYLKVMTDLIHSLGGRALHHSCGTIWRFIPELIACSVDVLDPIQPTCPDMYWLSTRVPHKISSCDQQTQKLQDEIVELQRVMLANRHRMQVELRAIVDQERFTILRQRLRYLVAPTPPVAQKQEPSPESKQPADPERNRE
jgi:hypothetical protein